MKDGRCKHWDSGYCFHKSLILSGCIGGEECKRRYPFVWSDRDKIAKEHKSLMNSLTKGE